MKVLKKRSKIMILLLSLATVLLSGCGGEFGVRVTKDNRVMIEAKNAEADSLGSAGSFTVEENQKVVIESDLKDNDEISIRFLSSLGELNKDSGVGEILEAVNSEEGALQVTVSGSSTSEYQLEPGDYMVSAKTLNKVNGTVSVRAE